ncbi:DUF4062 domain-containing protein [Lacrimispora sp.]|uniref:DUF4062 domain-containing protein n=1 Tax=Lacrimispora sp. TaxID=2719234 RepID=UPI0028A638F5|nr:DUF4062 domain-containing protein [Lacrimispora sp.]
MEKRYQIFISSTFADLENERKGIMESIIELGSFPTGMEMFPATDTEQFEYIKTVIDESDYYVLVIAGRYGSVAEDGISYTEKEFLYAKEKGIPILTFVKKDIESISANKTDQDVQKRKKLDKFRAKALDGRMANFWDNADELKYKIHSSLSREFKTHPRAGWIRGDVIDTDGLLTQYNSLKKEYEDLQKKENTEKGKRKTNINDLKRNFTVDYNIWDEENEYYDESINYEAKTNLYDIIVWCGSKMLHNITISQFGIFLNNDVVELVANDGKTKKVDCRLTAYSLDEIKIKLLAFGLIEASKIPGFEEDIRLSSLGKQVLFYTVKNEEFHWYIDSGIE